MSSEECERRIAELLGRICQRLYSHSRHLVRRAGLTRAQLAATQALLREGESSTGALARRLSLSAPTLSGILDRLEEKGLVERRRRVPDRRTVWVRATAGARMLLTADLSLLSPRFAERLSALDEEEKGRMVESLGRLADLLAEPNHASSGLSGELVIPLGRRLAAAPVERR